MYAKAFFEELEFDSVTVSPYMGKDSVEPFLAFQNKHVVLLALTSNAGAFDFQTRQTDGESLYKKIIECSREWSNKKNLMYVVGATKATYLTEIRKVIPDSFLLVPGVGAQGGSLEDICKAGMNDQIGILINSSRNILYASNGSDFAKASKKRARELQVQMEKILIERTQHS